MLKEAEDDLAKKIKSKPDVTEVRLISNVIYLYRSIHGKVILFQMNRAFKG